MTNNNSLFMLSCVNTLNAGMHTETVLKRIQVTSIAILGRIINTTSVKGRICLPKNCAYGITKYGGEAFSDILRLEMRQFGVKVVVIEPGNFGGATGMLNPQSVRL